MFVRTIKLEKSITKEARRQPFARFFENAALTKSLKLGFASTLISLRPFGQKLCFLISLRKTPFESSNINFTFGIFFVAEIASLETLFAQTTILLTFIFLTALRISIRFCAERGEKEYYIPYVKGIIKKIIPQKEIMIEDITGLFD